MKKLKVLDLFSGIGGFSLGLERTGGFETVAFCEIEKFPRKVLAKHWPNVPIAHDVRKLSYNRKTQQLFYKTRVIYVGRIDAITGGFPCQDLSLAGRLGGIKAERSGLWGEIARPSSEIGPCYIIVENVANLLAGPSEQPGWWFGVVLADLATIGYDAEWHCLPACNFNAPHERDRTYVIAYPKGKRQSKAREFRRGKPTQRLPSRCEKNILTHYIKERIQRGFTESLPEFSGFSWCKNVRRVEDFRGRPDLPTPLFRGSRDGLPDWMDRIAACGNSVLPQILEMLGYAILEFERQN